jgi:hypothetical protein
MSREGYAGVDDQFKFVVFGALIPVAAMLIEAGAAALRVKWGAWSVTPATCVASPNGTSGTRRSGVARNPKVPSSSPGRPTVAWSRVVGLCLLGARSHERTAARFARQASSRHPRVAVRSDPQFPLA